MFPIIEDRAKTCNCAFTPFAEIVRTEKRAFTPLAEIVRTEKNAKDMYAKIKIKEEQFAYIKT